jgi:hypothetical protein
LESGKRISIIIPGSSVGDPDLLVTEVGDPDPERRGCLTCIQIRICIKVNSQIRIRIKTKTLLLSLADTAQLNGSRSVPDSSGCQNYLNNKKFAKFEKAKLNFFFLSSNTSKHVL